MHTGITVSDIVTLSACLLTPFLAIYVYGTPVTTMMTSNTYSINTRFYGVLIWLSRDLITEEGGLNLYEVTGNDLLNYVDYCGHFPYPGTLPQSIRNKIIELAIRYGKLGPGLPRRLVSNYVNKGGLYTLTKDEVVTELKPITSLLNSSSFKTKLSMRKSFKGTFSLPSGTILNGTLGNFATIATVEVRCVSAKKGGIYYDAKGTAVISDKWNFDWKLWQYVKGKLGWGTGNGRTPYGQKRTIQGSMIPGQAFPITSDQVKVQQRGRQKRLEFSK